MEFTIRNFYLGTDTVVVPLDGTGVATLSYPHSGGDNWVKATYLPNTASWLGSVSADIWQRVNRVPTTMTMTRSASSARHGQVVNFVATVSPRVSQGTVTFFENGGNPVKVPVVNGIATWGPTGLFVGTAFVSAIYDESPNYVGSNWAWFNQAVRTAYTSTTVYSMAGVGDQLTFSAQVRPVAPSTATPTGSVQFSIDGVPVSGYMPVGPSGVAWFSASSIRPGRHTVGAVYYPTPRTYNASRSARITVLIR